MKKIALVIISFSLLLVGQQAGDEYLDHNEYVRTGTILAIENNRMNFDEMWLDTAPHAQKGPITTIVSDISGAVLSFHDLEAPCKVELIYRERDTTFVVSKITVLEQYYYDDMGFICTDQK